MTVKIVRKDKEDPLENLPGRDVVEYHVAVLQDESASLQDKSWAAGQLRGQWLVLSKIPARKKAADYINEILTGYRYPNERD